MKQILKSYYLSIEQKHLNLWQVITGVGILLLAFALRVWKLNAESLWIDEAFSIVLSRYSITDIIQGSIADQHPPLYYILLHFWLYLGTGDFHVRLFSVFIGVFHIAQVIFWGRKIVSIKVGLSVGLLLSLSPMHIWYSQEARMYILLTMLTTLSSILFWECLQGKKRYVWYVIFSLLAFYTHYFAVFIMMAHAIFTLIWVNNKRDYTLLRQWVVSVIIIGVGITPWIPTVLFQIREHSLEWLNTPTLPQIRDTFLKLILGGNSIPNGLHWFVFGLLISLYLWGGIQIFSQHRESIWLFGFVAIWGALPLLFIVFVSLWYPIFQTKQLLFLLTPFVFLLVWDIILLPSRLRVGIFLIFTIIFTCFTVKQQEQITKDDWRSVTVFIQQHFETGDLIYSNPAAISLLFKVYIDEFLPWDGYPQNYHILRGGWSGGKIITPEIAAKVLEKPLSGVNQRIWFIEFAPQLWDPNKYLEHRFNQYGESVRDQTFGRIRVRLYQLQNN